MDDAAAPESGPRHEFRLAIVAASAALLGALVGGLSAFGASVYQAGAQRDLAIRQARQEAYASLSLALSNHRSARGELKTVSPRDPAAVAAAVSKVCARTLDLQAPMATVLIIASQKVGEAALAAGIADNQYCSNARTSQGWVDDMQPELKTLAFINAASADVSG